MATSGAQLGNDNATKGREYRQALRKAMARKHGTTTKGLETIAKKLVDAAEKGESWAIKEIADRIDGKPSQALDVTLREKTHEECLLELDD